MGKHDYLYSLSYEGELRDGFSQCTAIEFLTNNLNISEPEAIEFLENEFSVCRHTCYSDVLKVHKEFFAAGIVLKLSKEKDSQQNQATTKSQPQAKNTPKQGKKITVRACVSP